MTQLPLDVTDYKVRIHFILLIMTMISSQFGTFPFRQSQTSSANGHYNRTDWLNRVSSSFRSVNMEQVGFYFIIIFSNKFFFFVKDSEMLDIELLDPTFGGLNFSITGSMRAGIFVKEILDKGTSQKHNKSDQLQSGWNLFYLSKFYIFRID
jgi:hypothetical protein